MTSGGWKSSKSPLGYVDAFGLAEGLLVLLSDYHRLLQLRRFFVIFPARNALVESEYFYRRCGYVVF